MAAMRPEGQAERPSSNEEITAEIERFKAEGRRPQWVFGWWRHQMALWNRLNPNPPTSDFPPDDPRSKLDEETRMWLVLNDVESETRPPESA
jgi:hypothetical protein